MEVDELKPNAVIRGPLFSEPVQIAAMIPMGSVVKVLGKGLKTVQFYDHILTTDQFAMLEASPDLTPFDGSAGQFRLGIEALRLGLAYEYGSYFALSIAHIDPR